MNKKQDVILYSLGYCPHCVRIKAFLDIHKVAYLEFDAEIDEMWDNAMKLTGGIF